MLVWGKSLKRRPLSVACYMPVFRLAGAFLGAAFLTIGLLFPGFDLRVVGGGGREGAGQESLNGRI